VYAQLTDEGLRVIEKVAEAHFANEARILSGMSAKDQASLAELLRKLEHSIVDNQTPLT
jgi:DNA-binding MarR family transcriptional regulator